MEPGPVFNQGVSFVLELTNEPLLRLVAEGPPTKTEAAGRVTFSSPMAFQRVGGTFPQLSLRLHVGEVREPIEDHLEALLAKVTEYRQSTRTLIGLFPEQVRQSFFAKPANDRIIILNPHSKATRTIDTNTPILALREPATIDDLRDVARMSQIEERYLLTTSRFKSKKESQLAITLSLLTRAEQSTHDHTIQFLHLFSAVETLCGGEIAPPEVQQKNSKRCSELRELAKKSFRTDLIEIVDSIEQKINLLPLSGRFKNYQNRWELRVTEELRQRDAEVMNRLNLKRNSLLHRGEDTIQTSDVIDLESLVSRYLDLELAQCMNFSGDWVRTVASIRTTGLIDPEQSVNLWVNAFEEAKGRGAQVLCGALADLVHELPFSDEFQRGRVLLILGQWHISNASHAVALELLDQSIAACQSHLADAQLGSDILMAQCLWNRGLVLERLCRQADAREALSEAKIKFDEVVSKKPELLKVYGDNLAICRILLASTLDTLGDTSGAECCLSEAYNFAIQFEKLRPEITKGRELAVSAISSMAWSQFRVGKLSLASQTYLKAIDEFSQAKPNASDECFLGQGLILFKHAGHVSELLGQHQDALDNFDKANKICMQALELAPNRVAFLNNGSGLKRLEAQTLIHLARLEEAKDTLEEAIRMYLRAKELADSSDLVYFNGGCIYVTKTRLMMSIGEHQEAKVAIRAAEKALEKAKKLNPNPNYYRLLGEALIEKSKVVDQAQPLEVAFDILSQAIVAYGEGAEPLNLAEAYRFRSLAAAVTNSEGSKLDASESIRILEDVIGKQPDNAIAHDDLAATLFQLAEYYSVSEPEVARNLLEKAARHLQIYLQEAPDSIPHLERQTKVRTLLAKQGDRQQDPHS